MQFGGLSPLAETLAFEHSSAVVRDPDPDDLDSLATSHNHLVLRCGKPDADDTGQELRP
jgi:hypothetical protein